MDKRNFSLLFPLFEMVEHTMELTVDLFNGM